MDNERMNDDRNQSGSRTVAAALDVLDSPRNTNRLTRLLPFLGPAFIASVAYIDPGNFATNIAAGAQFGYMLIWVIVASNLMAMLIQTLSAKLGIATGMNLAEHCRQAFPKPVVIAYVGFDGAGGNGHGPGRISGRGPGVQSPAGRAAFCRSASDSAFDIFDSGSRAIRFPAA